MSKPKPVTPLVQARHHYERARTALWQAHGLLVTLNLTQAPLLGVEQALTDNQASIDYLNDVIRNLQLGPAPPQP